MRWYADNVCCLAAARVPKCRWCRETFARPAERRAHICDKKKGKEPVVEPSTSEMQVQKPKRVNKRKPKVWGTKAGRVATILVIRAM